MPLPRSLVITAFCFGVSATVLLSPSQARGIDFVRGDCNSDGAINLSDGIYLLAYLFPGPSSPTTLACAEACNADDDSSVSLADAITLLDTLFGVSTLPLPPPSTCGLDPTPGLLGCATSPCAPPSGMVLIPGGEFEMGDHAGVGLANEQPVHLVEVDGLYMNVHETTVQEYCDFLNSAYSQGQITVMSGVVFRVGGPEAYCDTTASQPWGAQYGRVELVGGSFQITPQLDLLGAPIANHPMIMVSWYGAAAFANWRSEQAGQPAPYDLATWNCSFVDGGYRLPTEAEWEHAARGGEHAPYYQYPWGDTINGSHANYQFSGDPYEGGAFPQTTPVGYYNGLQLPSGPDMANGYGLYDMSGNVWEFCNDWFDDNYYAISPYDNPTGPVSGTWRVLRGGLWNHQGPQYLRCAYRGATGLDDRHSGRGFRLVRD